MDFNFICFYYNLMAIAIVFVAIFWQFYGEYNRFYCDFRAKKKFVEIMWRKKNILVELQGNIFLMKIIYFISIIIENVA